MATVGQGELAGSGRRRYTSVMRYRRFAPLLMLLASPLAVSTACAHASGAALADETADAVTVSVTNRYKLNVTVFSIVQGRAERLGEVTAYATAEFLVDRRRLIGSEIQLRGNAIGSGESVTSDVVHVSPGDTVGWALESDLSRSSIVVRN